MLIFPEIQALFLARHIRPVEEGEHGIQTRHIIGNHVDFFLIHRGVRLHIKIVDDFPAFVIGHLAALGCAADLADEHLIHVRCPV